MSIIKTLRSTSLIRYTPKKRSMLAAIDKNKGAKACSLKKVCCDKKEARGYLVLPLFPCWKVSTLLEKLVKNHVIRCPRGIPFFCSRLERYEVLPVSQDKKS